MLSLKREASHCQVTHTYAENFTISHLWLKGGKNPWVCFCSSRFLLKQLGWLHATADMQHSQPFLELAVGSKMLWAAQTRTERLLKGFLLLPVYETDIYTDSSFFFSSGARWQCGNALPLNMVAQLRVLYRSSSSGLDWPKSISAGSALTPEPSAGQQEKCKVYSFCFCSF